MYCREHEQLNKIKSLDGIEFTDFAKLIAALKKKGLVDENLICNVGGGEITVHPPKKELLAAIAPYGGEVLSNCLIYEEQIHSYIKNEGRNLNVSVDTGTRESFKKVKGKDAFEKVRENLLKYSEGGGHIKPKYIMIPESTITGPMSMALSNWQAG